MTVRVRAATAAELTALAPPLSTLLKEAVDQGASLGFLPPLDLAEAAAYWTSLSDDLRAERRVLLVAETGSGVVGAGQLFLPTLPNARHRAEVHKLFVAMSARGTGVGRTLMDALHAEAARRARSLLLLNTRRGEAPELFYRHLGYRDVGIVPGYTVDARGDRHDTVILYRSEDVPHAPAPPARSAGGSWLRLAAHPATVRRALVTAAVVGTILVLINHGDALLAGRMTVARTLKAALTVLVPYVVSTVSSVSTRRELGQ